MFFKQQVSDNKSLFINNKILFYYIYKYGNIIVPPFFFSFPLIFFYTNFVLTIMNTKKESFILVQSIESNARTYISVFQFIYIDRLLVLCLKF